MNNRLTLSFLALGVGMIVLSQSVFTVDQTEQAIVLQLGQPVGDLREPGLHFKLPIVQEVRRFDRRILSVDPAATQMVISSSQVINRPVLPSQRAALTQEQAQPPAAPVTPQAPVTSSEGLGEDAGPDMTGEVAEAGTAGESAGESTLASPLEAGQPDAIVIPPIENVSGEPIIVDSYARYRINDPLQFMKTLRSVENANIRVEAIIDEATRTILGRTTLKDLLSSERTRVMENINSRIIEKVKEDQLGIEIVDVRIVRTDLGEALRDSTVRRMNSEMRERATETRALGEQYALEIRALADKERAVILAEAQRDGQISRGTGDEEAIAIYAEAFNQDKEFYAFNRSLEAYRNTLADPDTRLILSPRSEFFRYFEGRR